MAEDSDGIEEALTGQIRMVVTAAGLVGETIARAREQQQRRAQAASEQQGRTLESRITAERQVARAELAVVHPPEWWSQATPEQIGRAYQVARAWSREEPEAIRAEQRITQELRSRYGIDTANTNADPAAVRAAIEQAEHDRTRGDSERSAATDDHAEAQMLLAQAEQQDRRVEDARQAAGHEPDPTDRVEATAEAADSAAASSLARDANQVRYDSAERRDVTARDLESQGFSKDAVTAKMCSDVSQARPAADAVKGASPVRSIRARKTRGRGAQVQRPAVER